MLLEFQREFAAAISAPAEGAMRVYRNTALGGCIDALRANYPVVARLLGEQMFNSIAADYVAKCPPRRPVLAMYGGRFPDWLEEQSWIWDIAYIPDVARIERHYVEALFAVDAEALTIDSLKGEEDWSVRLTLHPAARFDWLSMPAMSIWLAQRDGIEGEFVPEWQAEGVLLTRPVTEVQPLRLERAGHRFLFGIRIRETIAQAAIATATLYPETDIGSLVTSLINAGAFASSSPRSVL